MRINLSAVDEPQQQASYLRERDSCPPMVRRHDQMEAVSDDKLIKRGCARPAGFDEAEDRERQKKRRVKSRFMKDAEKRARDRREAAVLVQRQAKAQKERQAQKEQAKASLLAAEASLKEALTLRYGRPPTNVELSAARDAALMERLAAELGRTPTEAEAVGGPVPVGTDNRANMLLSSGEGAPSRMRHAIRRFSVFVQRVQRGECLLRHVPDPGNASDFLTKFVDKQKYRASHKASQRWISGAGSDGGRAVPNSGDGGAKWGDE